MEVRYSGDVSRYWDDLDVYLEMSADGKLLLVTLEDKDFRVVDLAQLERNSAGGGAVIPPKKIHGRC